MRTVLVADRAAMGQYVARHAAAALREAIQQHGGARMIVATGSSQFEVLESLVQQDVPWHKVTGFHLDEYVGLRADHPASFCGYLRQRLVDRVPLAAFHYLSGDRDAAEVIQAVGKELTASPIDVALVGIGENGHLAFNDPPADFQTRSPYLIVQLDTACRQQQVGEGWFADLEDVPTQAISMSIHQIMQARRILCSVPDQRKARAVADTLQRDISPAYPASILRGHGAATLVIDRAASTELKPAVRQRLEQID